jgi:hypothetical protein
MKKSVLCFMVILAIVLTALTACQSGNGDEYNTIPAGSLPLPTGPEAPDDIVPTPGGFAYSANVHQMGEPDKWPSIQSANVTLGSGSEALNINYRNYIDTKAGETRNNIIFLWKEGGLFDEKLELYSIDVADGIRLTNGGGGGRPGILLNVLAIEISPEVAAGQYTFQIGIEVGGKDYGTIPCTVSVIVE